MSNSAVPGPARGIAAIAGVDPNRVAIVAAGRRVSFGELDASANALACILAEAGVVPADRVAVMLGNVPEIFSVWNAISRLGAVVVPVSWRLTAPEIAYVLSDSRSKAFVHDGSNPAAIAAPDLLHTNSEGSGNAEAGDTNRLVSFAMGDPILRQAIEEGAKSPPTEEFLGSPVTAMAYTSGTTGRPKGVARPAPEPARVAPPNPFAVFWGFVTDDVHLLCGPAYHTAPGAYAQMTLTEGGRVVMMDHFDPARCLALIEEERVTNSHMVPANFVRILEVEHWRYDLSSVRKILHGAAPCPIGVKRKIMEVFPPGTVWEYYGASEGMACVISPEEWLKKPGSVGRAFPGMSIRILGEDEAPLPAGEVGQIYISSTGQHFAYHNDPDKTERAFAGDYFTVGDMGSIDEDGYLFLADRRDDLIISGGVNIYPAELEAALIEDEDVVDAAVIGLPDERMGQYVHAIVERRHGASVVAEDLLGRVSARLAAFKLPRTIEFVERLPREPNGKVLKNKLRAERIAGGGTTSDPLAGTQGGPSAAEGSPLT